MALRVPFDPTLDGGPVSIGDGSASKRSIRIEVGEYATPFWLRTESGLVIPVTELPWQGVVDDAELEVLSEAPGNVVGPFYEFDPNNYATTEELRAASSHPSLPVINTLATGQTLFDGSTGGVLRQTYPGDGTEGNANFDLTITDASLANTAEIWVEIYIRFDDLWTMEGVRDDKTLFITNNSGTGRWEWHYGLFGTRVYGGASGMADDFFIVSDSQAGQWNVETEMWDGLWHRVRLYVRMATLGGANDGAFHWITDDEVHISDVVADVNSRLGEPFTPNNTGTHFTALRLGANAQPQGSGIRDFGRVRVFNVDPGWVVP